MVSVNLKNASKENFAGTSGGVRVSSSTQCETEPVTSVGIGHIHDGCYQEHCRGQKSCADHDSPEQNADFQIIKLVARVVLQIVMKFWAMSGAAILAILLLYWLYGGCLALVLLCFASTGILYHAGDKLLYHPDQPLHSRVFVPLPSMYGMPFENLLIRSKDSTKINMYFMKQPDDKAVKAPTVLFLHGNAGNIGHRLSNAKGLYQNLQCNILMVEYRGYGHSEGVPSEEGLYMDAQAALEYLYSRPDIDHQKIILFGRSLGGAVAAEIGIKPECGSKIACLVLENTFTSIPDIARVLFNLRIVRYFPKWFYKNQFKSSSKVPHLKVPTLFISGLADGLIPPQMMLEMYQLCGSSIKRLAQFEMGTHNETWMCQGYYHTFTLFIDDVIFTLKGQQKTRAPFSQNDALALDIPQNII